jgi:hypothetical protein
VIGGDLFDLGEVDAIFREAWVEDFDERVRVALARLPLAEQAGEGSEGGGGAAGGEEVAAVHAGDHTRPIDCGNGTDARCVAKGVTQTGAGRPSVWVKAAEW